MTANRRILIPAVIVGMLSFLLIVYSFYTMEPHPSGPPSGDFHHGEERNPIKGVFKNVGNLAIISGALCYVWLLFKKRQSSPSIPLKKAAKKIFRLHAYMGWAALLFTVIHGVYFIADVEEHRYFTGIAAFLMMLAIAVYGWLIRRVRNPYLRKAHLVLSNANLLVLLLHAGGFFILTVGVTLLIWLLIRWMDASARNHKKNTLVKF